MSFEAKPNKIETLNNATAAAHEKGTLEKLNLGRAGRAAMFGLALLTSACGTTITVEKHNAPIGQQPYAEREVYPGVQRDHRIEIRSRGFRKPEIRHDEIRPVPPPRIELHRRRISGMEVEERIVRDDQGNIISIEPRIING